MSTMKIIKLDAREHHGTALLAADDSVWIAIAPFPWDIATWLWWWLCPIDKKAFALLNTTQGNKIRVKVVRVAHRHVRFRGLPSEKK